MSLHSQKIIVPHVGEGVHYVLIKKIFKTKGEWVEEDGALLEIETDKALLEIPSPVSGYVGDVLCKAGDRVAVGDEILVIELQGLENNPPVSLANFQKRKRETLRPVTLEVRNDIARYADLPDAQIELIHHMRRSEGVVIQASIEMPINWGAVDRLKKAFRAQQSLLVPTSQEIVLWCVSQSMFSFPKFRSRLTDDLRLEISEHANVGIALASNDDTILTSVISVNKEHKILGLTEEVRGKIQEEKKMLKKGPSYHSLVISDMSSLGVIRANPVVVSPSVATLFIGVPYWVMTEKGKNKMANIVVAFDHRAINGAYAAKFIKKIEENLYGLEQAMQG